MRLFSVPADFKYETIQRVDDLNNQYSNSKVIETYGQITVGGANSGRSIDVLPQVGLQQLEKFLKYSLEKKIEFNYTFNQSCTSNNEFTREGRLEIKSLLSSLKDIGVNNLTIAAPSIMELVMEYEPNFNIKASAICEINSVTKALFYKNLGVNRIVVDPDITRKFDILKNICNVFNNGVEIIVTNACIRNCPYKMFHYNYTAHDNNNINTKDVGDYYDYRCFFQSSKELISNMKLNWIRPEDIHFYSEVGITCFKIDGRQHINKGDFIRTLKIFFEEKFDGNLFELINFFENEKEVMRYLDNRMLDGYVEKFYKNPNFCNEMCDTCNYCLKFIEDSPKTRQAARTSKLTASLLWKKDTYRQKIKSNK